jgi:predicted amidophosphoribosyltransferase
MANGGYCPVHGIQLAGSFCGTCGTRLTPHRTCPSCTRELRHFQDAFCIHCGKVVPEAAPSLRLTRTVNGVEVPA